MLHFTVIDTVRLLQGLVDMVTDTNLTISENIEYMCSLVSKCSTLRKGIKILSFPDLGTQQGGVCRSRGFVKRYLVDGVKSLLLYSRKVDVSTTVHHSLELYSSLLLASTTYEVMFSAALPIDASCSLKLGLFNAVPSPIPAPAVKASTPGGVPREHRLLL